MTEMKFIQGDTEFKLTCWANFSIYNIDGSYSFKLEQREKGKRKWLPIKEQKFTYAVNIDLNVILKYLSKEQVMSVAELEYQKASPSKILFNE